MRKKWSSDWVSSSQPRKQRKYRFNAPAGARRKMISAHLSPELRKRYGRRAFPLRKGDTIKVMNGESKGVTGNVERIDLKGLKVYVENIKVKKADGSEVMRSLEPSNLLITSLNTDDKKRGLEKGGK